MFKSIIMALLSKIRDQKGEMMRSILMLAILVLLVRTSFAYAADVTELAACTVKIFKEINQTHKWSGKPPAACPATVAVEKRQEGVFITIWKIEKVNGGWVNTAFSSAEGYWEIANKKDLSKANYEIMSRARRLDKCLDSILTTNDPLECRQKAVKSYQVGDAIGTEKQKTIWLDDNGRHAVVEFSYGTSETEPTEPGDIIETSPLPNGMDINIVPQVGGGKHNKNSTGPTN
jgi:hypothetical protein